MRKIILLGIALSGATFSAASAAPAAPAAPSVVAPVAAKPALGKLAVAAQGAPGTVIVQRKRNFFSGILLPIAALGGAGAAGYAVADDKDSAD